MSSWGWKALGKTIRMRKVAGFVAIRKSWKKKDLRQNIAFNLFKPINEKGDC
jgi:hypothetical protein